MALIGTNIGMYPNQGRLELFDRIPNLGALRFPPRLDSDDRWLLEALVNRGDQPWLVMDGGALEGHKAWALDQYKQRYADLPIVWQIGNEPDGNEGASWAMNQAEFSDLLATARTVLGPEAYLVAGGLSGGWAGWLKGVDLSPVNAIAVHPYGRYADRPPVPGWGFGSVTDLLWSYRQQINAMGYGNLDLHVTEYGAPRSDLALAWGGYMRDMTQTLSESGLVNTALQFCLTDLDVEPFGLFDRRGTLLVNLDLPELPPMSSPPPTDAHFVLGFKEWHDADPGLIGDAIEEEWGAGPGISQQRTTHGVLTWADLKGGAVRTFLDTRDGRRYRWDGGTRAV